ncbi:MAG: bifunctional precorrin-2 dehydrogenase/sirohydrochlorin ferrochelatase [Anaerovoracaceae bacterium]
MENKHFPLFINGAGKKVIVFGGGKIATRRINTLIDFDFEITVVSTELTDKLKELVSEKKITFIDSTYKSDYINNQYLILACTDDRNTNKEIGVVGKSKGILVNIADAKEECDFFFPAIAGNDEIIVGIMGNGQSHKTTKEIASKLREIIDRKVY